MRAASFEPGDFSSILQARTANATMDMRIHRAIERSLIGSSSFGVVYDLSVFRSKVLESLTKTSHGLNTKGRRPSFGVRNSASDCARPSYRHLTQGSPRRRSK